MKGVPMSDLLSMAYLCSDAARSYALKELPSLEDIEHNWGVVQFKRPKEQYVYAPGEPQKYVYWLSEGLAAQAIYSQEGRSLYLSAIEPYQLFGAIDYSEETKESLIAVKASVINKMTVTMFRSMITAYFGTGMMQRLEHAYTKRLLESYRNSMHCVLPHDVSDRIEVLVERAPSIIGEASHRLQPGEVARFAYTSRECVSRYVNGLPKEKQAKVRRELHLAPQGRSHS